MQKISGDRHKHNFLLFTRYVSTVHPSSSVLHILKSPLNLNRARSYKVRYIASAITRTESGDIFITNENCFIEE